MTTPPQSCAHDKWAPKAGDRVKFKNQGPDIPPETFTIVEVRGDSVNLGGRAWYGAGAFVPTDAPQPAPKTAGEAAWDAFCNHSVDHHALNDEGKARWEQIAQAVRNFDLSHPPEHGREEISRLRSALELIERIDSNTESENREDGLPSIGEVCQEALAAHSQQAAGGEGLKTHADLMRSAILNVVGEYMTHDSTDERMNEAMKAAMDAQQAYSRNALPEAAPAPSELPSVDELVKLWRKGGVGGETFHAAMERIRWACARACEKATASLRQQAAAARAEIERLKGELATARKAADEAQGEIDEISELLPDESPHKHELTGHSLYDDVHDILKARDGLRETLNAVEGVLYKAKAGSGNLLERLGNLVAERDDLKAQVETKTRELRTACEHRDQWRGHYARASAECDMAMERARRAERDLVEAEDALRSEKLTTAQLQRSVDGMKGEIRALKSQQSDWVAFAGKIDNIHKRGLSFSTELDYLLTDLRRVECEKYKCKFSQDPAGRSWTESLCPIHHALEVLEGLRAALPPLPAPPPTGEREEVERVPLETDDFPPGSAVRCPWQQETTVVALWSTVLRTWGDSISILDENEGVKNISYATLVADRWQIKRPGEDWAPCSKPRP